MIYACMIQVYICNVLGLQFIQGFPATTITRSTIHNPSFQQRTTSELQIWPLVTSLAAQSQYLQEVIIVRELIASALACFVQFDIYDALFDFTSASCGGSTQGAAGICQFPGCLKPVFPGSNFCSIIHRECASLLISTLILDFNLACLMLVWQSYSSLAQGRATVQEYANSLAVQSQSFQEVIIVR